MGTLIRMIAIMAIVLLGIWAISSGMERSGPSGLLTAILGGLILLVMLYGFAKMGGR